MKATLIRFLVVAFAIAAFGLLAFSPIRAQSSASSNNQSGPAGCCGNTNSQISCGNGFNAQANPDGTATCVPNGSSNNTSSNTTNNATTSGGNGVGQ